jgi:hypothetical protein
MTGGEISSNNVNSGDGGGGVYVYNSNFTMTGGEISGNHADGNGGGVCVDDGSFTMTGDFIYGNEDSVPEQLRNTADTGAAVYDNTSGTTINVTIDHYPYP